MNSETPQFVQRQMELTGEFAKYLLDHPEIDEHIPDGAYLFFEIEGETEFNRYGQQLAERRRQEGFPVVVVRCKGLHPVQGSRLIDPVVAMPPTAV